jgi:hypothetical protein
VGATSRPYRLGAGQDVAGPVKRAARQVTQASDVGIPCRMATTRQKQAARQNLKQARRTQSQRANGQHIARPARGLSTADKNDLPVSAFAFPEQRKEPLVDATHVRNAVARFDQVEGVSEAERDKAWRRIRAAARRFDVDIPERGWRQLMKGGATGQR